jgi:hypothetical protein
MQRITTRDQLINLANELGTGIWHELDEIGVTAETHGTVFDNAGGWPIEDRPAREIWEMYVTIKKDGKPIAAVNLATLFAWATEPRTG